MAPRAKRDLRDVWRYYAHVASPEIADKLLREISQAAQRLADDALRWRARDEVTPGLRSVLVHPYTVFYRPRDDAVEVVRVLHERRNFPAAFSRKGR
jgi:toxin ParE1/3/4